MAGSLPVLFAVALLVGALLFSVGSLMVHANAPEKRVPPSEAQTEEPPMESSVPVTAQPVIAQPVIAQPFIAETFNTQPVWTRAFVDSDDPIDVATRLEMIARLALIGEPWCESILQIARAEEHDREVRAAITVALAPKDAPA